MKSPHGTVIELTESSPFIDQSRVVGRSCSGLPDAGVQPGIADPLADRLNPDQALRATERGWARPALGACPASARPDGGSANPGCAGKNRV